MKTGSNDPCPCGSGKKYKQCCLQAQQPQQVEDLLWHQIRRAISGLPEKLLKFSQNHWGSDAILEAWGDFTLWREEEFSPDTPHMQLFMPWFFFNWHPDYSTPGTGTPRKKTTGEAFLGKHGRQLDPLLKRYIEQCCVAPFSFFDIVSVRPGGGFLLRDILTGEECYATEHSASVHAEAGQIVFGKLAKVDHVAILEASAAFFIPPGEKFAILELRKELLELENPPSPALLGKYEHEMLEIYQVVYDRLFNPPMPSLRNTDGDTTVFQKLVYDIPSPQAAFTALRQLCIDSTEGELLQDAEFNATGELHRIEFPWLKKGNAKHKSWDNTILGQIRIKGRQLTVEVNSDKRAQQFQKQIKKLLPEARYKTSVIESPQAKLKHMQGQGESAQARQRREEQEELNNRPEVQEKIMELMREHYRQWPHEKLPALDGKTPLQAAKTKSGQEKVEALLRDFELRAPHTNLPVDPAIFAELRERFGLNKPEK
ncbi:MAG: SEC-C domain-containing protein [Nitrosomonas sp.]|uniref:SEC-C metal-binding domain-containing protein n=1 Tax=Nitrosomonas sp. TaxID=42353 RepID=UPI001D84F300|nr:SEC-C metal-binding domain-containing protein [Nitrosomonas sp.]MBX9895403.1 SEC-C domain-containing protein [Nitrosomonas sp.]